MGGSAERVSVVFNPVARGGRAARDLPLIEGALRGRGMAFEVAPTHRPGEGTEIARAAVERGFSRVIAAGGDGTVHEVANGLRGSAAVLAVLPMGSGNDFARLLGLRPGGLREALDAALGARVERVDLAQIRADGGEGEEVFLNNCGFVLEAEVVRRLPRAGRLSGLPLYGIAVARALVAYRRAPLVTVQGAGVRLTMRPVIVQVGNGCYSGGGFRLTPRASVVDGLLDVCVVEWLSLPRLLGAMPRALTGTHLQLKEVSYFQAAEIRVGSNDSLAFHLDGELRTFASARSFTLSVLPRALRLAVPETIRL